MMHRNFVPARAPQAQFKKSKVVMNGIAIPINAGCGEPFKGDDDKIKNPLNKLANLFNMKKMPLEK